MVLKEQDHMPKGNDDEFEHLCSIHTTYLKSGRPFTFNDYDPEERNSKVALQGCSTILQDTHAHSHFIFFLAVRSEKGQLLTFVTF